MINTFTRGQRPAKLARPCVRVLRPWAARLVAVCAITLLTPAGKAATGAPATASSPAGIVLRPPLPVWPSDYETIGETRPVFRLNGRYGAKRYRIEIAPDESFAEARVSQQARVEDDGGITPVVFVDSPGEPLTVGRWYWRAFCAGEDGDWTPPANHRVFFVSDRGPDRPDTSRAGQPPRLLIRSTEIPAFCERAARSEALGMGWRYLLNAARQALEVDPPDESYARSGAGQHGNYSLAANWYHRHLLNVAFAAAVTGERRFADQGVRMLMTACGYRRWLGPLFDDRAYFDPPWTSALETAMMTVAVATGYDMLYPFLDDTQRREVREALAEKGVRPLIRDWVDPVSASRLPRHQTPTGNWVMVCTGSAGIGALALLGEHPEAAEWVRLARDRTRAWLLDRGGDWFVDNPYARNRPTPIPVIGPSEPNFGPCGGYKESIGYMHYAMIYVAAFGDALQRLTGEDIFRYVPANLLEHPAFSTMSWPDEAGGNVRTAMVDFGDSGPGPRLEQVCTAMMKHRRDGLAAWLYRRTVPAPTSVRSLLWHDDTVPEKPPSPDVPMAVFPGIGQVVLRAGWSPSSPMAAIKFHQNRGHHDLGQFVLFGPGGPSLIDSGVAPYGSDVYDRYAARTHGHNVVLVDDRGQTRADGRLQSALATSRLAAASGQLAAAYPDALQSWIRDLVLLPGGVVVVADELIGIGPRRFDLLLHPGDEFSLSPDGELVIGRTGRAVVRVAADGLLEPVMTDGFQGTLARKYVRWNTREPVERQAFLTVCHWPEIAPPGAGPPLVETEGPSRRRLTRIGPDCRMMLRTGREAAGHSAPDARLVAVWEEAGRRSRCHAVILGGNRLTLEGRELFRSTHTLDAAIEFASPLRAHLRTSEPARVQFAVEEPADYVHLDGQPVKAARIAGMVALDVPAGESRVEIGDAPGPLRRLPGLVADDLMPVRPCPDALAYRNDARVRASSEAEPGLMAVDGDPNTAWVSMPGFSMPQWIDIKLPEPRRLAAVIIDVPLPCAGRLEEWNESDATWNAIGGFEASPRSLSCTVPCGDEPRQRIRVLVETLDPNSRAAAITEIVLKETDAR